MKEQCVICKKGITKKDNYFEVNLFIKGKLDCTDYAHQSCWLNRNQMNNAVKELTEGALRLLKSTDPQDKVTEMIIP